MASVTEIAAAVGRALESLGVEYFVGGSVASSLQGHARSTNDIDVVVNLRAAQVDAFGSALGDEFLVDTEALRDAMLSRRSWNIFHQPSGMRIDIFHVGTSEFDVEELFRRRRFVRTDDSSFFIKSPEDTVLRKLLWFRAGGEQSSQQWRDVVDVLRVQRGNLQEVYLDRWANKLGIVDLLNRARDSAQ